MSDSSGSLMVGLLSSVGLGTWETWMSDSLQGLGVDVTPIDLAARLGSTH